MTYNLRVDNAGDGINSFTNRQGRVIDMLKAQSPDIVGFQECTHHMRAYLEAHLPAYAFVGCGRERDCTGESMAIAYRKDAFVLTGVDNFWLTATPRVPGSTLGGDQSACPRMATVVLLHPLAAQGEICVCNTHLDHVGRVARQIEAALLCAALDAYLHADAARQGVQLGLQRVEGALPGGDVRDQYHAEQPGDDGLGDVQYVGVVLVEDAADLGDDALFVRAQHADDRFFRFVHGCGLLMNMSL
jgi:endonuclease/exonuclease/phosphatase family metal-dependent hydrolase